MSLEYTDEKVGAIDCSQIAAIRWVCEWVERPKTRLTSSFAPQASSILLWLSQPTNSAGPKAGPKAGSKLPPFLGALK